MIFAPPSYHWERSYCIRDPPSLRRTRHKTGEMLLFHTSGIYSLPQGSELGASCLKKDRSQPWLCRENRAVIVSLALLLHGRSQFLYERVPSLTRLGMFWTETLVSRLRFASIPSIGSLRCIHV